MLRYGFPSHRWQAAKKQGRQILIDRARLRHLITYFELAQRITGITVDAYSYALYALFEEISREEDAAGRGMLSAIVVHKDDGFPGSGFFNLAQELGRNTADKQKCWVSEVTLVFRVWSR
jgi:hypothetical protein